MARVGLLQDGMWWDIMIIMDGVETAETFKVYVVSVWTREVNSQVKSTVSSKDRRVDTHFKLGKWPSRDDLDKEDAFSSAGPDDTLPMVLKDLADVIEEPLVIIAKKLWRSDKDPETWKVKGKKFPSLNQAGKGELGGLQTG